MVGHLEPENLRGAEQQCGLHPRRVGGKAALEHAAEQMAQRAEPAQHRRHQLAHQRAVAVGERGEVAMRRRVVELLVERPAAAQHPVEDVGGDAARRQPGRLSGVPGDQPHGPRRAAWPQGPAERAG